MSAIIIPFKTTSVTSKAHQMVHTTSYDTLIGTMTTQIIQEMEEVYDYNCPIDLETTSMREALIEKMTHHFQVTAQTILDDICRAIQKLQTATITPISSIAVI